MNRPKEPATAPGRADRRPRARIPVVQSTSRWLPLTEIWLANQVRNLPEFIESHVVCARRENSEAFGFVSVEAAEGHRLRHARDRALRRLIPRPVGPLAAAIRRLDAAIVHSHFGHTAWFDHRAVARLAARHVVSFYGLDVGRLPREDPRWLRRYPEMFETASAVLCEGPFMAGSIADLGCDPDKIVVQRLGVDLDRLPAYRPRSWDGVRPLRILMAGAFREKKGIPDAIATIGHLVRDGIDVRATLIGDASPGDDPAEKRRILAAIERDHLRERVRLLGYQAHGRLLAEAEAHDVFMSPSRTAASGDSEGGAPVSIIEMAAIGLPVVSTGHCDIPSVLGEPNRALLAPEADRAGLLDATRRLLDADWSALAHANRALVEREFDCRRQGERLARIYVPDADPAELA